jgi:SH3-like domain-containing protein
MTLHNVTCKLLAAGALVLGLSGAATAQQFVSIRGEDVNMRSAPSLASKVLWQLGRGYPLKVIGRKGNWFQIEDFENDRGWVARRLTSTKLHSVVKAPRVNVRAGPGTNHRVLRQAEYGDVFRVLSRRKAWVRVQGDDDRTGWIARRLLWGL